MESAGVNGLSLVDEVSAVGGVGRLGRGHCVRWGNVCGVSRGNWVRTVGAVSLTGLVGLMGGVSVVGGVSLTRSQDEC